MRARKCLLEGDAYRYEAIHLITNVVVLYSSSEALIIASILVHNEPFMPALWDKPRRHADAAHEK